MSENFEAFWVEVIVRFQAVLPTLEPIERLALWHLIFEGYCKSCGYPETSDQTCNCMRDE
jgi:hypothetical protein